MAVSLIHQYLWRDERTPLRDLLRVSWEEPMSELTCEQRRAIEYGIDQPSEEEAPMQPTLCSVSAHMGVEPGRSQVRKLLPGEPNPRDYQDAIAYAAMYRAWLKDREPEEENPRPRTHTIDYDVLPWTTP